ncbi:hypothetical protein GobsT_21720 [Gemmata obscuriglobus]|uniref:hypothetical protein n=1 Tax=Gemmata obscuriglobus TaxID=114 RepID=UPI00016C3899|nr:hypothetical protein [Gemmata obscuriglobus]QEG27416.1 hypothetical protein GobsT_21720 [Gemmata obscuriglobus]VTS04350.1 Uncharacterized protein OS=Chthoniobacter flavus Ellin428 GN=CfE428DRAFT_5423 PE=4 SV=1 [Gemmata obscuriglobus UQM 2246]
MVRARRVQFVSTVTAVLALSALLFALFAPALAFLEPSAHDTTHEAIRSSAVRVVLVWCFAWPIALARTVAVRLRVLWTLGCALLFVHIAVAFHVGHGWSHAAAWEHTRQVGGYGDGVFVNYAFALVWLVDVVWAWVAFGWYLRRPRWLTWAVHGFFLFIIFNAAVVFGGWVSRVVLGVFFVAGGYRIARCYHP